MLDGNRRFLSGSLRACVIPFVIFVVVAVAPVETVDNVQKSGGALRRPKFRQLLKICGIGGLAFET